MRRRSAEVPCQPGMTALGTTRTFLSAQQKLELLSAVFAHVFVNRHDRQTPLHRQCYYTDNAAALGDKAIAPQRSAGARELLPCSPSRPTIEVRAAVECFVSSSVAVRLPAPMRPRRSVALQNGRKHARTARTWHHARHSCGLSRKNSTLPAMPCQRACRMPAGRSGPFGACGRRGIMPRFVRLPLADAGGRLAIAARLACG
jgi:hypothetical protein